MCLTDWNQRLSRRNIIKEKNNKKVGSIKFPMEPKNNEAFQLGWSLRPKQLQAEPNLRGKSKQKQGEKEMQWARIEPETQGMVEPP